MLLIPLESQIDIDKLLSKDNLSEVFINRILKKNSELKNNLMKLFAFIISNNIDILKFLMPNAISDDILEILENRLDSFDLQHTESVKN